MKPQPRCASQARLDSLPATTLPLANADAEVFVVDLLALAGAPDSEAALAAALSPVLASEAVYKVGCGIAGDCRKLAAHHPAAFAVTRGCVDLSATWRAYSVEQSEPRCLWAAALAGSRDLCIRSPAFWLRQFGLSSNVDGGRLSNLNVMPCVASAVLVCPNTVH